MKKIIFTALLILTSIVLFACEEQEELDKQALLEAYVDQFKLDEELDDDILNVPSTVEVDSIGLVSISFSTFPEGIILPNGQINRQNEDVTVDVTVFFNHNDLQEETKSFQVIISKIVIPEIEFNVTFNSSGGSQVASQTVAEGGTINKPSDPTRAGYEFLGWFFGDDPFDFSTPITANITLTAKWEEIIIEVETFTLTFDSNGGSDVPSQTVEEGMKFIEPSDPTKEGYIFLGWFTEPELLNLYDFQMTPTSDLTLYAGWEEVFEEGTIYEHDFSQKGKTSDFLIFDDTNDTMDVYGSYVYQGNEFTLGYKIDSKGYIEFETETDNLLLVLVLGRRTSLLGDGSSVVKVNTFTQTFVDQYVVIELELAVAGTYKIERGSSGSREFGVFFIGIYETQAAIQYQTVTFDSKGGTEISPKLVEKGQVVTKPEDPVKDGVDFVGWSVDPDSYVPFDFDTYITEDITLYAHYAQLETFEVLVDGVSYSVKDGKVLPPIEPQFIEGKVFLGWLKDGEAFDLSTPITSNMEIISEYRDALIFEISLNPGEGILVGPHAWEIYEYEEVVLPIPTYAGHIFMGWFIDPDFVNRFNQTMITSDISLYALFVDENDPQAQLESGSYFESIYATWNDLNPSEASVTYREVGGDSWLPVDAMLIRKISETKARVDVVGLKEGHYELKIITSTGSTLQSNPIFTERHDRSGYAHFNFTEGIGGYKDDGTLKDDAIVIYVTEQNKNQVTIPGIGQVGLGWILNNNQYQSQSSNTYNPSQYAQSIGTFNKPIVIRFIGTVTVPEGATIYNSTQQGGSVGDNGNMVRMKNANHITLEGIGDDAVIDGWGFHFMASVAGRGIGFEVRNLTFKDNPEDAVGMEGTDQIPVRRGWLHNLTFLPGYHPNPAESDKAHGDGSADFKRGEYLTISYSVFDGAHKTNLIGATSTDKTYHITMHHNLWRNNTSRIPLVRRANVHMYNNVIETTDNNQNEASYAQNPRLDAYIFSEANYFQGTKNPSTIDQGAIKSYGDIKYSTYGDDDATVVTSRTQLVNSNNLYPNFDTNPQVFYYDTINQRSDVERLTDAVTARAEVYAYAGAFRNYSEPEKVKIHNQTPVLISESMTQPEIKINKGNPLIIFTILVPAEITLITTDTKIPAVLVTIYGEPILKGPGTAELEPGTYVIEASQARGASKGQFQGKDSKGGFTITLDSSAASEARINAVSDAIAALPNPINYQQSHLEAIMDAKNLYDALTQSEKMIVSEEPITTAYNTYLSKGKAYIESLIHSIGTVTEASGPAISAAYNAYNDAIPEVKALVTNLNVLTNAQNAFLNFAVDFVIGVIEELEDFSSISINERLEIENVRQKYQEALIEYNALTEQQKLQVTNSNKLFDGIEDLDQKNAPHLVLDFIDSLVLENITKENGYQIPSFYNQYIDFTQEQLSILTIEKRSILEEAYDIYSSLIGDVYKWIPETSENTDNFFNYQGDAFVNNAGTFTVFGESLTLAGKLNSSATITFTTTVANAKLIIVVKTRSTQTQGRLDINGVIYDLDTYYNEEGIAYIEVTLEEAGTYTIKRNNRELAVFYIEVEQ